jgi:hypothetical protein
MANENKQAVVTAIWENPERAFNCPFRRSGRYWENLKGDEYRERGKIRLALSAGGDNIAVFYNGSSRPEHTDVFTYLEEYALHTSGFLETLQRLAELYGISLQFSQAERQAMTRTALAREVSASLVEQLRLHPQGATARYLRDVRGMEPDGTHFGELTKESVKAVRDSLNRRGIKYDEADLKALGITEYYAEQGFNCVIPYYVNGTARGFVLRNIDPSSTERYRYSQGLGRGGYSDTLTHGEPAVFVEGQFDAIRLIQAGVQNVIGMGGSQIGDDIARLLKAHGITEVTYVPDLEYNDKGVKKKKLIANAIRSFKSAQVDGVPVIRAVYIAELPEPEGVNLAGLKIDADSYGKEHGNEELAEVVRCNEASWAWELGALMDWAMEQERERGAVNATALQTKFHEIYVNCGSPFERQRLKNEIAGNRIYESFGITPRALDDVDTWKRNEDYNSRIKDGAAALTKAVAEDASPERIGAILQDLQDAQATNTRDEWDDQLKLSFEEELHTIEEQPDTLKTKWKIGAISKKTGKFFPHDNIEFYPADIEVFCAPTSHGKTMILFQSALDLIRTTDKTFLYVSCEENKRQLLERALNVFIDIPTTPDGRTEKTAENPEGYCFKEQTRKKTIKAVIRDDVPPFEYSGMENGCYMGVSEHYEALKKLIRRKIDQYKTNVFPRLKLIHTEATIESICANVSRTVEEYRRKGVEVGGVFVDYMQLLTTESRNYSRHDELKDICKALKDCAARTELPVVIAAQLNREIFRGGIDTVTVANIGEGADIERIAHDVYLVWQIDKTQESLYKQEKNGELGIKFGALNVRSNRIYCKPAIGREERELKAGYIYVERMKARDGKTEGWGLLPYDGERGFIGETDENKMTE